MFLYTRKNEKNVYLPTLDDMYIYSVRHCKILGHNLLLASSQRMSLIKFNNPFVIDFYSSADGYTQR